MTENTAQKPVVGIVMGSDSDWAVMQNAALVLKDMGVAYEARVVSAHRMPDEMFDYAETAKERGIKCIIAGAGGAAHLPGMIAARKQVQIKPGMQPHQPADYAERRARRDKSDP